MNILVVMKLSDTKVHSKFKPFEENNLISKIYLLRDFPYNFSCVSKIRNIRVKGTGYFRHVRKIMAGYRLIKAENIEVVISYLLCPHGYIAWILKLLTNKPWVHCVLDGDAEFWSKGKIVEKFHLFIIRSAAKIVVMGAKTEQYLVNKGIPQSRIVIIPNIIDVKFFNPVVDGDKKYDVIYAGRIDENKNLKLLIDSISIVKNRIRDIQVGIAGDGPEKQKITEYVNNKGLSGNFNFLGQLDGRHVSRFMGEGKIFVLMSRHEGFPLALFEAMASQLACISTNVGEIDSLIVDGENGYLLDNPDDFHVLADRITHLLENPELRSKMANEAVKTTERYDAEDVKDRWSNLLLEFVHKNEP